MSERISFTIAASPHPPTTARTKSCDRLGKTVHYEPMQHARFNPPPNWPVPHGWSPPPGWEPDPSWPPAPPGWQFYVYPSASPAEYPNGRRWDVRWIALAVAAAIAVITVSAFVYYRTNQPDEVTLKPVDTHGDLRSGWVQDTSRSGDRIDCSSGLPSRYDKSAVVRSCGSTADSADACWPAADDAHVQCLVDPFSNVVYLIGAQGLSTPRHPLTERPIPFALVLEDGTQCRVRIGGAWSQPPGHPDWVGHYGCKTDVAVWGPVGKGISKGFGGWTVEVGPDDGPITKRKVAKAYYVAG